MAELYIGIMSGTSMDAIDTVLADFSSQPPKLVATHTHPLPESRRRELLELVRPGGNELERSARLDVQLGRLYAEAVNQLLKKSPCDANEIKAIGSHGQTVRHLPGGEIPYTVQIGDPNAIAQLTGITTVADFRRRDLAAGGQGAPLVPAFHADCFYKSDENRVVLNIGGMANITTLVAGRKGAVSGFDTGPGNVLLDSWINKVQGRSRDQEGGWARSGRTIATLFQRLIADPYFSKLPPKSTGREYFNLEWLQKRLTGSEEPQDVQATLCELTAASIAKAITEQAPGTTRLLTCGGGVYNNYLMERLQSQLPECVVESTEKHGLPPQWVEATAFAWLARQTMNGLPGNVPAVTGASEAVVLGGIFPGSIKSKVTSDKN